jgi:hypothetical protein
MPNKTDHSITPKDSGGFFRELTYRIKLIIRLMGDRRVNLLIKGLPIFSLVYLVLPDIAFGPIDDALVLWLGSYLFIELCPQEVVDEHLHNMRMVVPSEWKDMPSNIPIEGEMLDKPADPKMD